ncbi:(Fe-S)-binding protein [Arhodomonas aquaeolei]|uniref:(Fe-S)-binding protein n=1 Tax=Arhodomonas aquaeolei TaxID=2369 RepID=UPI00216714D4|nr:(Fe-S)-binding protein [Arhodomonas aquaeolei]MCS4505874.1 (Fe-S)-binding protein [Arhodomonas aquaeolei]
MSAAATGRDAGAPRVGLFVTCLVDAMKPSVGFASIRLLEAAGCEVVVPEGQTCCGQPGLNAGDSDTARRLARQVLEQFEDCDYVVVPSGSCAATLSHNAPELFPGDGGERARVEALAARTYELTDFLVNVMHFEDVASRFTGTVTYHDSCSGLRTLGVREQPRALLGRIEGVTLVEMTDATRCCGFGGTFSIKYGDIATRMANDKCVDATATGADTIAAGDLGCLMNVEGRLRRRGDLSTRVLHVAEILAWQ